MVEVSESAVAPQSLPITFACMSLAGFQDRRCKLSKLIAADEMIA